MNIDVKYSDLSKDLLKLYCSVRHSSIEDSYIKLSQDYASGIDLWLRKNKKIKNELSNPNVYDALLTLVFLRGNLSDAPKISDIAKILPNNPTHLKNVPIIISFAELLNSESNNLLVPFKDIILKIHSSITVPVEKSMEGPSEIYGDLSIINNAFLTRGSDVKTDTQKLMKTRKLSLIDQRRNMFRYLLQRFSDDLSSASDVAGFSDLAQQFRNGILSVLPPVGIGRHIELDPISDNQMIMARKMAEYVLKYPDEKYSNYHHDLVEVNLLQKAGSLTAEDATRFKQEFEVQNRLKNYMADDSEVVGDDSVGMDTGSTITGDKRLNPDYIYMLCMFFFFLQKKLRIPPSSFEVI